MLFPQNDWCIENGRWINEWISVFEERLNWISKLPPILILCQLFHLNFISLPVPSKVFHDPRQSWRLRKISEQNKMKISCFLLLFRLLCLFYYISLHIFNITPHIIIIKCEKTCQSSYITLIIIINIRIYENIYSARHRKCRVYLFYISLCRFTFSQKM